MKKTLSVIFTLCLLLGLLTGCGAGAEDVSSSAQPDDTTTSVSSTTTTTAVEEEGATTTVKPTSKKTVTKAKTTTTAKPTTIKPIAKSKVKVTAIAGPTGVGLVDLMEKNSQKKATNEYTFNLVSDPTQAVAAITGGTADIAAVPTNLASTLYKKTGGKVQVLAVNTLGVLYMLDTTGTVQSVDDLKGKTIYTSGQGANPEYILKYVLEGNQIDPAQDVTIQYVADNDALVAALVTGTAQVAMVPEPKVTACLTQMKAAGKTLPTVALNMTQEWGEVSGEDSTLMMGCVIARKEFVEKNPAAVKAFLAEYEASITAVKGDVETAASLCEKYGVIPKVAIAKQAIPRCNLTFVGGKTMKTQLSGYLKVLYAYNPSAIGGALPDDAFYYGA